MNLFKVQGYIIFSAQNPAVAKGDSIVVFTTRFGFRM